jgi:hypothetical protein
LTVQLLAAQFRVITQRKRLTCASFYRALSSELLGKYKVTELDNPGQSATAFKY